MPLLDRAEPARRLSLVEALLAAAAVVLLASAGCAGKVETRSVRAAVFRAARAQESSRRAPPGPEAFVERSLRDAGLRFGTDGSIGALYAYVRHAHALVPPAAALPGDIVFFDASDGGEHGCATHAAVVEAVDPDGRITFLESRGGRVLRSHVSPQRPLARRDESGRVLNSFLRIKTLDDRWDARYLAGEMLCAVGRVR